VQVAHGGRVAAGQAAARQQLSQQAVALSRRSCLLDEQDRRWADGWAARAWLPTTSSLSRRTRASTPSWRSITGNLSWGCSAATTCRAADASGRPSERGRAVGRALLRRVIDVDLLRTIGTQWHLPDGVGRRARELDTW